MRCISHVPKARNSVDYDLFPRFDDAIDAGDGETCTSMAYDKVEPVFNNLPIGPPGGL